MLAHGDGVIIALADVRAHVKAVVEIERCAALRPTDEPARVILIVGECAVKVDVGKVDSRILRVADNAADDLSIAARDGDISVDVDIADRDVARRAVD